MDIGRIGEGGRFHTLDGMRGIAALMVAAYHLQARWDHGAIPGYLAVDLFFALSGFVISLNYSERLANGLSLFRFCEIRLIRLLPLYLLGYSLGVAKIIVGFIAHKPVAVTVGSPACAILLGAVTIPSFCSRELYPLNGPSWSLFFEYLINIAFAAVLWRCSTRTLGLLSIVSAMTFPFLVHNPDYFNLGWAWANIHGGMARTIFSFCVGIVIHRLLNEQRRRFSFVSGLPIIMMIVVVGFTAPLAVRSLIEILIVVFVFPLLVVLGCSFEVPSKRMRELFGQLGNLSYPIYAIHWPLITLATPVLAKLGLGSTASAIVFVIGLIVVAHPVSIVDASVRDRISRFIKLRRSAPLQSS